MTYSVEQTYGQALFALQSGRFDDAERLFKMTLRFHPRHVATLNLYSILLTRTRRFQEAEEYINRALNENAASDASFYNYGVILKALKRPEEALEQINRALAINSSNAETWNIRGDVYIDLEQYQGAIAAFDKALTVEPTLVAAYVNKARALVELEQYELALNAVDHALTLQSQNALSLLCRGQVLRRLDRLDEALDSFMHALNLMPELTEAWLGYSEIISDLGRDNEALAIYRRALENASDSSIVYSYMGNLLQQMNRQKEASDAFRKSFELNPCSPSLYFNFVDSKNFKAGDPELIAMEKLSSKKTALSKRERKFLDFALGKAYADINDYGRSFQHYLAANAAERSAINYDENASLALFDKIEEIFTYDLINSKSGFGEPSSRPIFVVGMPRSGSTLIEQIVASHPAVQGAGEVNAFPIALYKSINQTQRSNNNPWCYHRFVPTLNAEQIKSIGKTYIQELATLVPHGNRVIDKLLENFLHIGLIYLALPNAVIIHTVRDPLDTCVSCFVKRFRGKIPYVYDLVELGNYYTRYRRLMQHWHHVLPPGRIIDVHYEDVITDLEKQARRILTHCALPWDDHCLEFHKTDRPVRTASVNQVRQPIYNKSVGRWRHYEEYLTPLLMALGIER